jgi:hypothetical protein
VSARTIASALAAPRGVRGRWATPSIPVRRLPGATLGVLLLALALVAGIAAFRPLASGLGELAAWRGHGEPPASFPILLVEPAAASGAARVHLATLHEPATARLAGTRLLRLLPPPSPWEAGIASGAIAASVLEWRVERLGGALRVHLRGEESGTPFVARYRVHAHGVKPEYLRHPRPDLAATLIASLALILAWWAVRALRGEPGILRPRRTRPMASPIPLVRHPVPVPPLPEGPFASPRHSSLTGAGIATVPPGPPPTGRRPACAPAHRVRRTPACSSRTEDHPDHPFQGLLPLAAPSEVGDKPLQRTVPGNRRPAGSAATSPPLDARPDLELVRWPDH